VIQANNGTTTTSNIGIYDFSFWLLVFFLSFVMGCVLGTADWLERQKGATSVHIKYYDMSNTMSTHRTTVFSQYGVFEWVASCGIRNPKNFLEFGIQDPKKCCTFSLFSQIMCVGEDRWFSFHFLLHMLQKQNDEVERHQPRVSQQATTKMTKPRFQHNEREQSPHRKSSYHCCCYCSFKQDFATATFSTDNINGRYRHIQPLSSITVPTQWHHVRTMRLIFGSYEQP